MTLADLQRANKLWKRRLDVVLEMERWMGENLSRYVKDGCGDIEERKHGVFHTKGKEYLYCHLLLGKTMHPNGADPLFTDWGDRFDDPSLQTQLGLQSNGELNPEKVDGFRFQLENLRRTVVVVDESDTVPSLTVLIEDYVGKKESKAYAIVSNLMESLQQKGLEQPVINEHMIGLILRYRCIGGFESNQHGEVSSEWSTKFPGMIECFASPLNHVFENYYSVFEEDKVFGSSGNLFKSLSNGQLPMDGIFEMNPPFEDSILKKAENIVHKTFGNEQCTAKLIMFSPCWEDATFYTRMCRSIRGYTSEYAAIIKDELCYNHIKCSNLTVRSAVFVFVGRGCRKEKATKFIQTCREIVNKSVQRRGWAVGNGGSLRDAERSGMQAVEFSELLRDLKERRSRFHYNTNASTTTLRRVVNLL